MKKCYLIALLFTTTTFSQTVIGEGLFEQNLLDYIVANYKTTTTLGYGPARDILYGTIDLKENNQLSCVYSGYTITLDVTQDPSTNAYNQGINCEHSWPQSMGAGDEPQKSDMHHLFPCKSNVNSSRGNDPFAEIPDSDTDKWYRNDYYQETIPTEYIDEYAEKYNPPNASDEQFEPREIHKGDAARAMFYFFALYNNVADTNFWNLQKDVFLDWHYYDPADTWETDRTWEIAGYQENNPNPFVIDSTLARRIWFYDSTGGTANPNVNIVITEVMPNPSAVSDSYGEWFEVYNADTVSLDLNGWIIKDDGSDTHTISVTDSLPILPGGYLVFGRNEDSTTNGGFTVDYEYSNFTLGNSTDEVLLVDTENAIVDQVAYTTSFPFGNGASMYLIDMTADNNDGSNWTVSTMPFGDGDYGTPGKAWNDSTLMSIGEQEIIPKMFQLYPAYPNPFNPTTTIRFNIGVADAIMRQPTLKIFDITGRLVETLAEGEINPGQHEFQWNASQHPSGVYFITLKSGNFTQTQKILLLK
ncbi:MAG: T9SS type A sorting domain-containing protein [Candidatus Marinimicrobia bacterium]|jgi:endonuclease I|nr:T9SS type A sorting domain-containing protein [Candidatus Neomarinimicrobiota bacterium]